jgi:peroxiredoxin
MPPSPRARLVPGTPVPLVDLVTVTGAPVPAPAPGQVVHLQFRRFAGCPVCNLHLRSFARRHDELVAAGVREVAIFHSTGGELLRHAGDLPFALVADPDKALYRRFAVEASPRALLDPRAWLPILRAIAHGLGVVVRGGPLAPLRPAGGRLGLPADFLVGDDGRLIAAHYGQHVDDHWSVDQVLASALTARSGSSRPAMSRHWLLCLACSA